jgi:hypothetical protein
MVLASPIALPDLVGLLQIETVSWNLAYQQEFSGLGSGEGLAADLAPPLWEAECASRAFYHREVERWRSRFLALDGSMRSFMLYNPAAASPETDPSGTILAGSSITVRTVATDRNEISFAGLPVGFVIPWGTYAQIQAGSPSRVALVQLLESRTATGLGNTSSAEVRPHLRPWVSVGDAVTLVNAAAKVKLMPGSLRVESVDALMSRLRFTARQTLAAG